MRINRKSIIAAAVGMAVSFSAIAAESIIFDPSGTAGAAGNINNVFTFDWNVGNAVALDGNPAGGLAVGDKSQLVYQANLQGINDGDGNQVFGQGTNGYYFSVVASFGEVVETVGNRTATFTLDPAASPNFFTIYAIPRNGDNLTGAGFTDGTAILTGAITSVQSSNFTFSLQDTNGDGVGDAPIVQLLDQFGTDNLGGQQTAVGGGQSSLTIDVAIAGVNANYFPDLFTGNTISLVFFTSEQKTPYTTGQPSTCFLDPDASGTNDGCDGTARDLGPINGIPTNAAGVPNTLDYDFQFQVDGSNSFERGPVQVPEPGTLALLGLGLGALGLSSRRRKSKA